MAEYIVDGAVLRCDKGQFATKLMVPFSRIHIGGKAAASDKNCVPMANVQPFGRCCSSTYINSSKAKEIVEKPCVLDLMDHYYYPDESQIISDAAEILELLESCRSQIRRTIRECVKEMTDIQHMQIKEMNYGSADEITKQYAVLWKATENIHTLYQEAGEVRQAICGFCTASIQNCAYLKNGNQDETIGERIKVIEEWLEELAAISRFLADLPETEECHLITMESFGICRCGGILFFEKSGQ